MFKKVLISIFFVFGVWLAFVFFLKLSMLSILNEVRDRNSDFASIDIALKSYYKDHGRFPSQEQGLAALVSIPTIEPKPAAYPKNGYLLKLPIGRNGEKYYYYYQNEDQFPMIYSFQPEDAEAFYGKWVKI